MNPTIDRLVVSAAASLFLAGCVVGPSFDRSGEGFPAKWREENQATPSGRPLATNWWAMYGDGILDDLERRALLANQDLRKAVARVDENRATVRAATSARYPALDLTQSYERNRVSETGSQGGIAARGLFPLEQNRFRTTIDGSYELDLWGKVRRTVESVAAQSAAVEASRDTVLLNLTADVAENHFNLRSLDAEISVLERTLGLLGKALDVNRTRVDTGIGSAADVSRAETEWAHVRSDLADVRRRRSLLLNGLAVLCGEPASVFHLESMPLRAAPPPEVPAGVPSELLLRRPDVAEAEQLAASQCAEVGVAKAAFLPSVQLTGYGGLESLELRDLFTWDSKIWAVGPNVSLPIFSGGRNRANLKVAEARYEQAVAAYRQILLGAFRDVEDALSDTRAYAEQALALDRALDSARRTSDYFDRRLQGGMIGFLDAVDAQRSLLQAERASVQNLGARYTASVQLIKSLGGGWSSEVRFQDPSSSRRYGRR